MRFAAIKHDKSSAHLRRYKWLLILFWTGAIATSLVWNVRDDKRGIEDTARSLANLAFEKDVIYRRWVSRHGGVYVPVTEETSPNPYLSHLSERDITTLSNQNLTLVDPAYMSRQVYEFAAMESDIKGHITSLHPLRPENTPDEWETKILKSFEQGIEQASSVELLAGQPHMRLMRPLYTEQSCLKCHGQQGYQLGDLRGGISVSVPMASLQIGAGSHILALYLGHSGLWTLGLVGIAVGMRHAGRHVRDRDEAERSLQAAKDYTDQIIGSMSEMLLVIAPDGTLITVNTTTCNTLGYQEEELIGHPARMLFLKEDSIPILLNQGDTSFKQTDSHSFASADAANRFESFLCTKNGSRIPVLCSASAIGGKEGHPCDIVCVAQDITERKDADEELRKLSLAVEQSPASVVITDTQGIIEYVNPRFTNVTGYSAEEAIGQNPRLLKSGNRPKESYRKLWDTILGGNIWTGAFENRKKNGELYWEEASICPIRDAGGSVTHFVAVKQDITRRKETENALRKSEAELRRHRDHLEELVGQRTAEVERINDSLVREVKERRDAERAAESACTAKGDFLATMSHELRTPLNGIIGMTELLLTSGLTPAQRKQAGLVKASGDILLRLINDILDYSKIEAGKLELEIVDFDLRDNLECIATLLAPQAQQKGLELSVSVNPGLPTDVRGDPGRLHQILANLVSNAIKFTESGEIVIRAVVDKMVDSKVSIRISVTDTGIGIPSDKMDRLFESFSQLDASHSRRFGGTGLGLAISKQLIEMMGGEIGASSEIGRGSTFWFCLTLERSQNAGTSTKISTDFRHTRILAVDDNATNREILDEQLTSFGIAHELASGGELALQALRSAAASNDAFAVAIIDLQMPGIDGEQLAQTIKDHKEITDTILVMLTSAGMIGDEERMKALGFSAWLSKPIRQSQLLDAITQALACARVGARFKTVEAPNLNQLLDRSIRKTDAKILAAEDNEIGQEVIRQVLSNAGYVHEVVPNGRLAVNAWYGGDFDLILMDCQMPEMDGFESAREIRRIEEEKTDEGSTFHRVPIIALTANALKGDREKCLEVGMDDHVPKPFDPVQLIEAIETQLAQREKQMMTSLDSKSNGSGNEGDSLNAQHAGDPYGSAPTFDIETVLNRWGGDREFVQKLIDKFLASAPSELEHLTQFVAGGEVAETTRVAHGLKGAAAYCGAERFRAVAARLEEIGRNGDLNNANECVEKLRFELDRCVANTSAAVGSNDDTVDSVH